MKLFLFLAATTLGFSQSNDAKLYITSISNTDTLTTFTKYTIEYELKNESNHEILFYNTIDNPLLLNYRNTSEIYADFFVYDEQEKLNKKLFITNKHFLKYEKYVIETDQKNIENQKVRPDSKLQFLNSSSKMDTLTFEKKRDSMMKIRTKLINSHNDFDYVKNSLVTLKTNESIKGTVFFFWYKKMYRKMDEEEFFIDEKPKEIELTMLINKRQELQRYFSPTEYKKIAENPHFIDGYFISDKKAIIFKE